MKSLIKFLSIKLIAIFFVFNVNAQEFNDLETYSGSINGAYNIANLPLLPGNWKVDDLEKSGSVQSGNFYVYATLVPSVPVSVIFSNLKSAMSLAFVI